MRLDSIKRFVHRMALKRFVPAFLEKVVSRFGLRRNFFQRVRRRNSNDSQKIAIVNEVFIAQLISKSRVGLWRYQPAVM
jgi:hypothetical protein